MQTGCGKSTQLPQFILDHEIEAGRGAQTRIVVTQPRRVSALGLASRVADERMEDLDQGVQTVVSLPDTSSIELILAGLCDPGGIENGTQHTDFVCHHRSHLAAPVGWWRCRSGRSISYCRR